MSCIKRQDTPPPSLARGGGDMNSFETMQPRVPERTPPERRNGSRVKSADRPPTGVYLPNNNVLAPHMRSPEYVQISTAAAMTLGLMPGRMHRCECTRCLNLLLTYPEGCRANCAYCGLHVTARPIGTMPTATSSGSTGRRCRSSRWCRPLRAGAPRAPFTACASR